MLMRWHRSVPLSAPLYERPSCACVSPTILIAAAMCDPIPTMLTMSTRGRPASSYRINGVAWNGRTIAGVR